jgi:SET domain-containing protein
MPSAKPASTPQIRTDYANFKLTVKPSKIHRWGIYAGEEIPARRKIIEYTGERINTVIQRGHILYMSVRKIRKGEELTVDYHFAKDVEDIPCKCGAERCRGTINLK